MNVTRILYPLLLILSLVALADPDSDSDAVNERLPVRKAELESHWQIDCQGSWSAVRQAFEQDSPPADCRPSTEQRRQLELCAFIYQPPGEKSSHSCPDYRGLLRQLEAIPPLDCGQLADWLDTRTECTGNSRTK